MILTDKHISQAVQKKTVKSNLWQNLWNTQMTKLIQFFQNLCDGKRSLLYFKPLAPAKRRHHHNCPQCKLLLKTLLSSWNLYFGRFLTSLHVSIQNAFLLFHFMYFSQPEEGILVWFSPKEVSQHHPTIEGGSCLWEWEFKKNWMGYVRSSCASVAYQDEGSCPCSLCL